MALDDFIQKMMVSGQLSWENGVLTLLQLRGVLIPAPTFIQILLKSNKNLDSALNAFYEAGYYHGKELVIKGYGEQIFKMPKETLIHQFGASGNLMGLGKFNWTEFNPESKKLVLRIEKSVFVEEIRKLKIKTKSNVCSLIVGIAAGMGSGLFQSEVKAKETKCALHGSESCEIIIEGISKSRKKTPKKK